MSPYHHKFLQAVACLLATSLPLSMSHAQTSPSSVHEPLVEVADIPLPGPAVRFDYQNFDASGGRLYISHMDADHVVIFDVASRKVELPTLVVSNAFTASSQCRNAIDCMSRRPGITVSQWSIRKPSKRSPPP
ncbi:MAG: hypothetical protein GJU73_12190, partial [Ferrovum sp.]|nr:hypothetical protein [Ferrovum sp.]